MQTTKEHTRKLLLRTAREAFLEKGFKAVSMREISKQSGVGLSNIYNYYSSKDDLLEAVLQPLLVELKSLVEDHSRTDDFSLSIFTSEAYHRSSIQAVMDLISRYRREFRLLFFHAQDSRFEDYWERWIDSNTEIGMAYMERVDQLQLDLSTSVSPFFMHFTCTWWMSMIREVVLHDDLSQGEIEHFIGEYIQFCTGGWGKLMNVERAMDYHDNSIKSISR